SPWFLSGSSAFSDPPAPPVTALVFISVQRPPPPPPLFPYATLLRSLPGPLPMLAVAVPPPASMVPFTALTVIVSVWFVFTALVAAAGVMWMFASTHVLLAGLLLTRPLGVELPSVVRDTEPSPASGMSEVADTTVVPVTADVITTLQLAVRPPPV